MTANRTSLITVLLTAGLVVPSLALAQGVGNLPSLPTQFSSPLPITGWSVDSGNATDPWIPVQIDPNGPQWVKKLTGPNGSNFIAGPGDAFTLQELLVVAPNEPWTDWHEQILTPGWDWVQPYAVLANGSPVMPLNAVVTPGNSMTGGSIDFYFPSLAPGTQVIIRKVLQYTGLPDGSAFFGTIDIAQYPTPEPASLALLGMGGLLALRRSRRA